MRDRVAIGTVSTKPHHWLRTASKRDVFLAMLAGASLFGIVAFLGLQRFLLTDPSGDALPIVVVAPLSGPDAGQGEAMLRGAQLAIEQRNAAASGTARRLVLTPIDETLGGAAVAKAVAASGAVAAIGHWSDRSAEAVSHSYADLRLPALMTAGSSPASENPWVFHTLADQVQETRFLANYVRNIVGEKAVNIVLEDDARGRALADAFDETLQRFGTKVLFRWTYAPQGADRRTRLEEIARDITGRNVAGTLLLLGRDAEASADLVATLRIQGVRNRFVALRDFGTAAFIDQFQRRWNGAGTAQAALNGTLITTPLLYDTAGPVAQNFQAAYTEKYQAAPDWLAGEAFDAARRAAEAVSPAKSLEEMRRAVRNRLQAQDRADAVFATLAGPAFFDKSGRTSALPLLGSYDGTDLVAAMTQLSPIREEGVSNYLGEITAGRALYVNDRFMYKTNVVYTGVKVHEVANLDLNGNTAAIKFTVWFRWRGNAEPQNVVFTNAVEPITLDKPERQAVDGDMNYRAYKVKGRFFINTADVARSYGTQLVGLSFHHATLSRNNLMYVSDILGMGISQRRQFGDQLRADRIGADAGVPAKDGAVGTVSDMLKGLNLGGEDSPLLAALKQAQVLAPLTGWLVDRAWISQEVRMRGSEGDPLFVGFGRPAPEFSVLAMAIILKPDAFAARDVLSHDAFLLIAVFALVGSVLAALLDRKDRGQFWRQQTLGLRIVCWPLLLMATANLALDYSLRNFTGAVTGNIVLCFSMLWWIVPARLLAVSLERFLWVPLERRTGRRIPNVVRMASAGVIYAFAAFGIIAFVFDKPVTSLLATGGLTAMIIGLAVKGNIANIFSGIVLNIERPFDMGDSVSINKISGEVIDMTWRTTRIQDPAGQIISLPNDRVSEAEIQNMSRARAFRVKGSIYLDPSYDPATVRAIVMEALAANSHAICEIADDDPVVNFVGIECVNGHWVSHFTAALSVKKGPHRTPALQELWLALWPRFRAAGIDWKQFEAAQPAPARPAIQAAA
ncbi:ABC transporter substrate-binding protein [Paracraurococcus lichenis]|uniref:Mechanosensitive ion channel n=1 Tax=Paracraurococcus lichenis TaxID=3064888 RepID=A0ABT9E990_9PROT|nr:ABC transporter substrate-binding protein [Paracraurococcus sp. LOR1-02]MDO9712726.1 mechanosensitive ion channel [Paracraurococcus sp. LOR1-02]